MTFTDNALDLFHTRYLATNRWEHLLRITEINPANYELHLEIPRTLLPTPPESPQPVTLTNIVQSAYVPTLYITNIIALNAVGLAETGFFRLADTLDLDSDGLTDMEELLVWGTDPFTSDTDGDGLINLHEYYSGTNPGVHDVHPASNALLNATLAIDNRIVGKNPATALPIFLDYIANGNNGVFIRNPDCWAADIDLTCCSPWNSQEQNKRAGTLISPRHVLFAAHYPVFANQTIKFVDRFNNVITRKIIAAKPHPDYFYNGSFTYHDLYAAFLDSDVPTNQISVAKVLPANFEQYLAGGRRLPCIRFDQEEKALIGDIHNFAILDNAIRHIVSTEPPVSGSTRFDFYEDIIKFDSSSPVFVLIDGVPVLLTVWTTPNSGTSITAFKDDINTLMFELEAENGGIIGYQLEEIDLSDFTAIR